jgi:uncharacterized protein YcfL
MLFWSENEGRKNLTFLLLVTLLFSGCKTTDNTQVNKNYWIRGSSEVNSGFIGLKPGYILVDGKEISFSFNLKNYSNAIVSLSKRECFKCKDIDGLLIKINPKSDNDTITLKPNEEMLAGVVFNYKKESKGDIEFIFQTSPVAEPVSLFVK